MSSPRTPLPGPRPAGGPPASYQPPARPIIAIPTPLRQAADRWSKVLLSERTNTELERALDMVIKHPDAYSAGYSPACTARRRLTAEIASRTEKRLNQLNTTRKPQPLP